MKPLTQAEKDALLKALHLDPKPSKCDCALRRLSREERAEVIDAAIDATNAEIRDGLLPEEDL